MKKDAFTFAEVLIAMAVIGIITVVIVSTAKPRQSVLKYQYANAYKTLSRAYYNSFIDGYNAFAAKSKYACLSVSDTECDVSDGTASGQLFNGVKVICRGLSEYINTQSSLSGTCSAGLATVSGAAQAKLPTNTSYTTLRPRANDMVFYFTKRFNDGEGNVPFYIVFIDLDGPDRGTNSLRIGSDGSLPDTYAFALLNNGRVTPLGLPEYDQRILSARLVTYDQGGNETYGDVSYPYYQAKALAWGYYHAGFDNSSQYDVVEPFTVNDYIRSVLPPDNEIYADCPTLPAVGVGENADNMTPEQIEAANAEAVATNEKYPVLDVLTGSDCASGNFESCFIHINEYSY